MSAKLPPPAWEKEHLWHYLLALGFDPAGAAAGKVSSHLRLGVNMFDKPNKDAFHIIAWFLFSKLDQSRCSEIFRFCFPPADKKSDSEFRKQCYEWLRKISDECGKNFPPIVASLFLSPGGPKFIHLMFHFARYVLIHHIKTDSAAAGIPYPEAVNLRSPDLNMALAKYRVAHNQFLQSLQKEDLIIQELQRKAQIFSRRIRDLRYENADLDKQLQKMERNVPSGLSSTADRIEKVRCLWTSIIETLRLLQNEREVVDSVIKGHVDQYILDGTNVAVSVPRPLLERIEKEMHELPIGNIYEEGKLNILTVIQLLTKALEMLVDERQEADKGALKLDLQYFEAKTKFQSEILLGLKSLRQKLKLEDHISISHSIAEKQQEWDLKWKTCLGQSPFHLIKDPNPALNLLPAMSPLSFTPATEEAYKSSVFCQYPASVSDTFEKADSVPKSQDDPTVATTKRIVMSSDLAREPENRTLSEKGSNVSSPKTTEHSDFQISKYKGRHSRLVESGKERQMDRLKTPSSVQREDPLQKAQEQLAEEVADTVVSGSPQKTGGKGKDLEDLIGTLISNPFLTRKQIPRTPENLITEIRSSWKKAIQAEGSSEAESPTNAGKDRPQDAVPLSRNQIDSSMMCFMSSCMSDPSDLPSVEVQSPCSFEQGVIRGTELPAQQPSLPEDRLGKQGLTGTFPDKCRTDHPELACKFANKSVSELGCGPGISIGKETLSPSVGQNFSAHTTLPWDGSPLVSGISSDSHEIIHLGILQETLPEEAGSISLNSFNDLEAKELSEENATDRKTFPDNEAGNERKLDFHSIRSRYEALKKTVLENSSSKKQNARRRSEFGLPLVDMETKDMLSPFGKPYALDAELVKTPTHVILRERKEPLSPLVAFSPVRAREKLSALQQGDLFNKLKEK
ncbi:hypothetical protein JRQ81_013390 [Phrynocephalus forsythii]|uniref:HAUS augmin-like complex subunit 6 N-terminal domain-containing protein n=1 Tax=Phrynocephalus forsythii TaxID=171643 RepID=A0A9Q0XZ29_9SAUR|nr:hypothetical protein JRQ81_013390 [Phrynocephalus forsythii]